MEERKHIVILAAGDFPVHEVPLRALREADFVVCCDSAYLDFVAFNARQAKPFVVIGDGDSLPADLKVRLADRYVQVDEQDYNDLHKAMRWATARFAPAESRFTILGATGRREDHTLGNIGYLVTFAEEYPGADIEMQTDHGEFRAMTGRRTFECTAGQQVSVLTMTPELPFSGSGLKWPLDGFYARRWWQATLNEALGTSFTLETEGWLVVFRNYIS